MTATQKEIDMHPQVSQRLVSSPWLSTHAPIKTLILDDSLFDRLRIKRLFQSVGARLDFDEAVSVSGLVECMNKTDYDLMLVDFQLPDGDGLEAQRKIRSHLRHRRCPVIMVAGLEDIDVAIEAMRNGATTYIAKDKLSVNALSEAVMQAMSHMGPDTLPTFREAMDDTQEGLRRAVEILQRMRGTDGKLPDDMQPDLDEVERLCIRGCSSLDRALNP